MKGLRNSIAVALLTVAVVSATGANQAALAKGMQAPTPVAVQGCCYIVYLGITYCVPCG